MAHRYVVCGSRWAWHADRWAVLLHHTLSNAGAMMDMGRGYDTGGHPRNVRVVEHWHEAHHIGDCCVNKDLSTSRRRARPYGGHELVPPMINSLTLPVRELCRDCSIPSPRSKRDVFLSTWYPAPQRAVVLEAQVPGMVAGVVRVDIQLRDSGPTGYLALSVKFGNLRVNGERRRNRGAGSC